MTPGTGQTKVKSSSGLNIPQQEQSCSYSLKSTCQGPLKRFQGSFSKFIQTAKTLALEQRVTWYKKSSSDVTLGKLT